jgi:hypothetical protein
MEPAQTAPVSIRVRGSAADRQRAEDLALKRAHALDARGPCCSPPSSSTPPLWHREPPVDVAESDSTDADDLSRSEQQQQTSPAKLPLESLLGPGVLPSPLEQPRSTMRGLARLLAFHVCRYAIQEVGKRGGGPVFSWRALRLDAFQLELMREQLVPLVDDGRPANSGSGLAAGWHPSARRPKPSSPGRDWGFSDDFVRAVLTEADKMDERAGGGADVGITESNTTTTTASSLSSSASSSSLGSRHVINIRADASHLVRVGIPESHGEGAGLPCFYLLRSHATRCPNGVVVAISLHEQPLAFYPVPGLMSPSSFSMLPPPPRRRPSSPRPTRSDDVLSTTVAAAMARHPVPASAPASPKEGRGEEQQQEERRAGGPNRLMRFLRAFLSPRFLVRRDKGAK